MSKKYISIFLCIIIVLLSFSSCSHDDSLNIVYPISADPECVDPQIADNDASLLIVKNCMEGLVRLDKDGKIQPGTASEWEISGDGLTYVFHLREDAKWQMLNAHKKLLGDDCLEVFDNRVKADDCVFGIIRSLRAETKAKNADLLYCIDRSKDYFEGKCSENDVGIKAIDDYTVKITLERRNDDFLRLLTLPICMPCNRQFFEATKAKYGLELKYTLFNGPFYIGKWVDDSSLTLFKSEVYKGSASVKTNAIYLYVNDNEDQYLSKFNQEDYNVVSLTDSGLSKIGNDDEIELFDIYNRTFGFIFNCSDKIISNTNFRKAIVYSLDLNAVSDSGRVLSGGIIPDSCRYGEKSFREAAGNAYIPKADKNKAIEYFNKALEELDSVNISLSIICKEEYRTDVIKLLQNIEKTFGLSMSVSANTVSDEDFEKAVKDKTYQIAFTYVEADTADSLSFLENFTTGNENNTGDYSDENYDNIIDFCVNESQSNDFLKNMLKAENMLIEEGAFYPVYKEKTNFAYWKDTDGVFCNENNRIIDFTLRGVS